MNVTSNGLYDRAVAALQGFKASYPEAKAVISGGFLRDAVLGRVPKDCDVFIAAPEFPDEDFWPAVNKSFGPIRWACIIPEDYDDAVPGIFWIGEGAAIGNTGVCFNVVLIHAGVSPVEDAKAHDFGICQIWHDGTGLNYTDAFAEDVQHATFTLSVCEDYKQFERSMRRWKRLRPRYPACRLVVPDQYAHWLAYYEEVNGPVPGRSRA